MADTVFAAGNSFLIRFMMAFVLGGLIQASAAEPADRSGEFQTVMAKIEGKLKEGKRTEQELAKELEQLDALLAAHPADKSDAMAQVLEAKANLYLNYFNARPKAIELFQRIKSEFPGTETAKDLENLLATIVKPAELSSGKPFPVFEEMDLEGKPISPARYKGKVLLIDFWAAWCGKCDSDMRSLLKMYAKYHDKGFEIIGISFDKDMGVLLDYLKEKGVAWPQHFDGFAGAMVVKYGVTDIPETFLLDQEGLIIGRGLHGKDLEAAVTKALGL